MYGVPESTLRDRTRGNVALDCTMGPARLFNLEEEKRLADHIIHMGNIGYGYPVTEVLRVAAGYAKSLGKTIAKDQLSKPWFYSFLKKHEELKL
ncbi:hypothetical protein DPMN_029323 [Dreissena polymorpha]|uniref:HTH CENPB-type domain-containing protein n=1 Tax=Dreissena polymorpha TaxID=45954 RepID=A0A9D4RFD2_DREPO|nr:hypothetical protein DPMN_029323 [Dreissena polymorpha]